MPFNLPEFNILFNSWVSPAAPAAGDLPTNANVPGQLYINARGFIANNLNVSFPYAQTIWLRMAIADEAADNGAIMYEVPPSSGRYYLARFKEVFHMGFPNEYWGVALLQCDIDGNPILRNV